MIRISNVADANSGEKRINTIGSAKIDKVAKSIKLTIPVILNDLITRPILLVLDDAIFGIKTVEKV